MAKSHNKKRSVGLLHEFLVLSVSEAIVRGDTKRSNAALRIIKRYFKPGTELYKEFRLVNALFRTSVSSEHVAASILQEAKQVVRSHDTAQLDSEKSLLISAINKSLNDADFYDRQVNEYRMLATIQTLINDWRTPGSDLGRIATYEDQLIKWLITERTQSGNEQVGTGDAPGSTRLLMKLMMKRLNERYANALSDEQKCLLRAYAFSTANDDPDALSTKLHEIKSNILKRLNDSTGDSTLDRAKIDEAVNRIQSETLVDVDDDTVTRFMLYSKLNDELVTEDSDVG